MRLQPHNHALPGKQLQSPDHQVLLRLQPSCRPRRTSVTRNAQNQEEGGSKSAPSSISSSSGSIAREQQQPAAAAPASSLNDVLSEASRELQDSLSLLKDAAGTSFVPGYKPKQQSRSRSRSRSDEVGFSTYSSIISDASAANSTQLPAVQPIPSRLQELLTGAFLSRRAGGSSSSRSRASKQAFDARLAAMQFELQAQASAAAAGPQQQEQQQPDQQPGIQVENTPSGMVIDVIPNAVEPQQQQQQQSQLGNAAAAPAAAGTAWRADAASSATAAEQSAAAAIGSSEDDELDLKPFPAATNVLVIAMWLVCVLQWWPALPALWLSVKEVGFFQALFALMFMYPDTPVTQALCMDLSAVLRGSLSGLLTSGLVNSGLVATWLSTKAFYDGARWIEIGLGPMELLATYVITSLCASLAHLVAGRTTVALAGTGAALGVYTAFVLLAAEHLKEKIPMAGLYRYGAVLLLLSLGIGLMQPAIGVSSVVGGVLGGALAVKLSAPLARVMQMGFAVPFLLFLFVLRLAVDGLKVVLLAGVAVVAAVVQAAVGLTQSVKRL